MEAQVRQRDLRIVELEQNIKELKLKIKELENKEEQVKIIEAIESHIEMYE